MAEVLRVIIGSKSAISLQRGQVDPKFKVEGVAPPTILLLKKLQGGPTKVRPTYIIDGNI